MELKIDFCAHTIFGFAGAVVGLKQVALHAAAGVGAVCISAGLTARPVHCTLVKICHSKRTASYTAHTALYKHYVPAETTPLLRLWGDKNI